MRICVFCGSSASVSDHYKQAAAAFGHLLVKNGIGLVYGGGSVGLMGAIADAVVEAGGEVIGIIPEKLAKAEVAHECVQDLRVVTSMHERKALMADLSDAFVALPGGIGTFEELFEAWTWAQLGYHQKPCGILNVAGFYDKLAAFLDQVVADGFLKPHHRGMLIFSDDSQALLDRIRAYHAPETDKLIERSEL